MAEASESSWPYVAEPTTDAEYSWLLREMKNGVTRSNGSNTLKGSADSSGMVTFLDPGRCIIQGFMYRNTATFDLTHDASTAQPRIDVVVIELDTTEAVADDRAQARIVKGTAAASPVVPSLTQTDTGIYQLPLYQVAIGAGVTNISNGNVTDLRHFRPTMNDRGTTAERPSDPVLGELYYNTTLTRWESYNGSTWVGLNATTVGGRTIYDSTSDPTSGDGINGDLWYVTEA